MVFTAVSLEVVFIMIDVYCIVFNPRAMYCLTFAKHINNMRTTNRIRVKLEKYNTVYTLQTSYWHLDISWAESQRKG